MERIVFIVDDSQVVRTSVRHTLERQGYKVIEAKNGRDGITVLNALPAAERPSMIITDVNMPEMDGISFIKEVKKTPHRFTPILVLTTEAQADKKNQGKEAGATGWLVKPFTEEQLTAVVKKLVR